MKKSILSVLAIPFFAAGCASNSGSTWNTNSASDQRQKEDNAEQRELRRVFESNVEKVPLFYRSNQSFDPDYLDSPRNVKELLEDFDDRAEYATGAGYIKKFERSFAVIVDGEPTYDLENKGLAYEVIWDTETPWCLGKDRCLNTPEQMRSTAVSVVQSFTTSDMMCKNPVLWRYLAYGATAKYRHYDAQGSLFYEYEISIDSCPRSELEFVADRLDVSAGLKKIEAR